MAMRLMITGAEGFLGGRLWDYYKGRYQVIGVGHSDLDITEESAVMEYVSDIRPEVLLHCAAISDTGVCQKQPKLSYLVNVEGTRNLGKACGHIGAKMVMMSSDQIYTGSIELHPNREEISCQPANIYGNHKLEAEKELLSILPDAVCLRLTWMYDMWCRGKKNNRNLFRNVIEALVEGREFFAPIHEYRGITDVNQVVRHMEQAWQLPGGVYNFGSPNGSNTYEITCFLISLLAPAQTKLLKADEKRYQEAARNLSMNVEKTEKYGIYFPDTKDGFADFLREYGCI